MSVARVAGLADTQPCGELAAGAFLVCAFLASRSLCRCGQELMMSDLSNMRLATQSEDAASSAAVPTATIGTLRPVRLDARPDAHPRPDLIAGHRILFVMAAPEEYGPALRQRITPLMTGIGPVEAAIVVSAALARLAAQGNLPAALVCLGSAGARHLEQGGVYQAASVSYRDMDVSALGFAPGITPGLDLPAEVPLPICIPGIPQARLSSGAAIVSGPGYEGIDADMVDMESFAVCRAGLAFGVPMIALRGISDGAAPLTGYMDWTRYLAEIDLSLAAAVDRLAEAAGAILPERHA